MTSAVTTEKRDAIAVVTVNNPPANALTHVVCKGLLTALEQTDADESIHSVVLQCSGDTFLSGLDAQESDQASEQPHLSELINGIEKSRNRWVAAIHGSALGGGLELALGCHYRLAARDAMFGFPQVTLGLIPGAGGTVRLPRLVAMKGALSLITSGKPCNADHAMVIGLIDAIAESNLLAEAIGFAESRQTTALPQSLLERDVVSPFAEDEQTEQLQTLKAKSRGQQSIVVAAQLVINAAAIKPEDALAIERKAFLELFNSDQSKALRYIYFAERTASMIPNLKDVTPRSVSTLGIIGGGTMGAGIAVAALLAGLPVVLIERDSDALSKGEGNIKHILSASLKRKIIDAEHYDTLLKRIDLSTDYLALRDVDFVIEAVFEDMAVKHAVFKQLDTATKPSAILASNTSYLDVNELADASNDPSRVIGLHFFSPAHIMKLVEVIRTNNAAADVVQTAMTLAQTLKKLPVPAGVCDGFIGNRVMSAYRKAGEYLLEDGALPYEVDQAMKNHGFAMGLFEMQDLAGLDIGYAMRQRQAATRDPQERYVDIADKLVEMGRLGRKTGSGYYLYTDGKTPERDVEVENLIRDESKRKSIIRNIYSSETIMQILLDAMAQTGRAIVSEGIADSPEAVDVVMVNGYGYPRWRGGPMFETNPIHK